MGKNTRKFKFENAAVFASRPLICYVCFNIMKRYPKIIDGKGVEIDIKNKELLSFACCDCGLIHTIAFAIEKNGKLGMAVKRDTETTNNRRKQKAVQKSIRQIAQENT